MYKISHFSTALGLLTLKTNPIAVFEKPIRFGNIKIKPASDNYSREHCTIILCSVVISFKAPYRISEAFNLP
jgi:hypothetical protein